MIAENNGALSDIRVVELGQLIAGPFCGQLLGDMGAEIIKVEPPQVDGPQGKSGGDPMRNWGHGDAKLWWEVVARNKKSVSANLRVPEGQEIVRKLVANADILIENFKPGTMEKWGLGPDALHAINPRLIIVRVSGYGQTGPYSSRAGFGGIGEAMGGWRYIVGDPDRAPSRMGVSIGDSLAATYGCLGALAALHARARDRWSTARFMKPCCRSWKALCPNTWFRATSANAPARSSKAFHPRTSIPARMANT